MNIIEKLIASGNTVLLGYVFIAVLLGLGIYFTMDRLTIYTNMSPQKENRSKYE